MAVRWFRLLLIYGCCAVVSMAEGAEQKTDAATLSKILSILATPGLGQLIASYDGDGEFSPPREIDDLCSCFSIIKATFQAGDEHIVQLHSPVGVYAYNVRDSQWVNKPSCVSGLGDQLYGQQEPEERQTVLSPGGIYRVMYGARCMIAVSTWGKRPTSVQEWAAPLLPPIMPLKVLS